MPLFKRIQKTQNLALSTQYNLIIKNEIIPVVN